MNNPTVLNTTHLEHENLKSHHRISALLPSWSDRGIPYFFPYREAWTIQVLIHENTEAVLWIRGHPLINLAFAIDECDALMRRWRINHDGLSLRNVDTKTFISQWRFDNIRIHMCKGVRRELYGLRRLSPKKELENQSIRHAVMTVTWR
ncbi:hypothetical protein SERLA73DRAFT_176526 [Serpula lacrymans var. lacrymans S7.3]|uniref:Uncharacterized protein n=2 Tax=Serpula lacrymans var. lacrymans TaxID=341189 RepID=F8PN42_SERL3|nr:uncharacterized protein SERLADRAFT_459412 [Serpula lacrymans var. lacrymans S7.9]EGO03024.1 hypothetical protein SERLA73DRAFT_176526 [Serpula lacrymans var. lacrymans S7.3]EGO28702.1 hypothetical protein SERLADRAFT_459412 [Serpula lacrymans var. lacrymans S7.9]